MKTPLKACYSPVSSLSWMQGGLPSIDDDLPKRSMDRKSLSGESNLEKEKGTGIWRKGFGSSKFARELIRKEDLVSIEKKGGCMKESLIEKWSSKFFYDKSFPNSLSVAGPWKKTV